MVKIANPIAASAAATDKTKIVKICPTKSFRKWENATKLIFTANKISSIDIRTTITFLRLIKMPKTPRVKTSAERNK